MSFLSGLFKSAASSLVGGAIGSIFGSHSARKQADLQRGNWSYAQKNAHQFEVQDLRNAGLNPILSATNSQIAGMGSAPTMTDFGSGSAVPEGVTSALQRHLQKELKAADVEIENKKLENDNLRIQNDKERLELDRKIGDSQIKLMDTQADSTSAKTVAEIRHIDAKIQEIFTNISNSISLTRAQINHLASGATLNYAMADKVSAEISKIFAETGVLTVEKEELTKILTDPKRELERRLWAQALRGENVLGNLHKFSIAGNELSGIVPSRIGVGFRR